MTVVQAVANLSWEMGEAISALESYTPDAFDTKPYRQGLADTLNVLTEAIGQRPATDLALIELLNAGQVLRHQHFAEEQPTDGAAAAWDRAAAKSLAALGVVDLTPAGGEGE